MIRTDQIRDLIVTARGLDKVERAFPSGVSAGDDRKSYLNASEAGKCTRWLWYDRNVPLTNNWLPHGVFDRGHAYELWATTYLAAGLEGIAELRFVGTEQTRLIDEEYRIAGTPDGLIDWHESDPSALEVKSHGSNANYDTEPSPMHVHQLELNIELFHECTDFRPADGILLYGLVEDYYRMAVHRIERRPAVLIEAIGKARIVFAAKRAEDCPPDGLKMKQCLLCPYRQQCSAAIAKGVAAAGTGGLNEVELTAVDRLVAARERSVAAADEASLAVAETEYELLQILTDAGASRIKRNGYAVALSRDHSSADSAVSITIRTA